jgi:hypothetical protein
MKKKKINVILVPVAVATWILIIFKIITFSKPTKTEALVNLHDIILNDTLSEQDTIELLLNYKDPFNRVITLIASKSPVLPVKKEIKKQVWPDIIYSGLVKSDTERKSLAILSISGKTVIASKGYDYGGVQIRDLFIDSIKLSYNQDLKTIKKKGL